MGRDSVAPSVKCSVLIAQTQNIFSLRKGFGEEVLPPLQCWGSYCALPIMDSAPLAIEQEHEMKIGESRGLHWDLKEDSASFLVTKKTRALKFGQPTCQSGRNMTWENKSLIWAAEMEMEESQQGCTLWMHLSLRPHAVAPINCPFAQSGVGFCTLLQETSFSKTPIGS